MSLKFSPRLLLAVSISSFALSFGGCATREEKAAQRRWETQDERTEREVFHSGWLLPPVPQEDRDFFYGGSKQRN